MNSTHDHLARSLRKLFRTRRRTTTNVYSKQRTVYSRTLSRVSILPPEVWTAILACLSDDFLLLAARICSTLNERCIAEYLHRRGISHQHLRSQDTITLPSDLLRVFALSAQTMPQAHTLVCTFLASHVRKELHYLRQLVGRAHVGQIQQLEIQFPGTLLAAHETESRQQLLAELEGVLKAVAGKTPSGPIVVLDGSDIHLVGPQFRLVPVKSDLSACRLVWEHRTRLVVRDITSIHCSVAGLGTFQPFSVVVFNHQSEPTVRFGANFHAQQTALNALLPHIDFPGALERVRIAAPMDPALITSFVIHHPTIQVIHSELSAQLRPRQLLTQPAALPSLKQIECEHAAHLPALLEACGSAPLLETISFPLHRRSPAEVAVLTGALRALAALPREGGELCMRLRAWDIGRHAWEPINEPEREVLEALDSITAVCIEADSVGDVRCQLPWLAMLPVLERVEVRIFQQWAQLAGEVRDALPGAAEVKVVRR